jgi:phage tail-like protein
MSDEWWPPEWKDTDEQPAFRVQRQRIGPVEGGDYVRARSGGLTALPQTAIRFPSRPEGYAEFANKTLLDARPYDYESVEILWGWPEKVADWTEAALVRSSYGRPLTPNDGQTVIRGDKESFARFLNPETDEFNAAIVLDRPLPGGRWYHYSLFFRTESSPLSWVLAMSDMTLLPRNFGHSDHLWNRVPPYYQFTDSQIREGAGYLRQFLAPFGFELDTTREYIESWQDLYYLDRTPTPLLSHLGNNFGVPYESGLGDIRYRSYLSQISDLYAARGTAKGLEEMVEAASKYEVEITSGANEMQLSDDSEFVSSTGSWGALHPDTTQPVGTWVQPGDVFMRINTMADDGIQLPPDGGRGMLRVRTTKAMETTDLMITVGDGVLIDEDGVSHEFIPVYNAISVQADKVYGFSVQIYQPVPAVAQVGMLWFTKAGQPESIITPVAGDFSAFPMADANEWTLFSVQRSVPDTAIYMVPAIRFTTRTAGTDAQYSPPIYITAAMTYILGDAGTVTVFAPDMFLTLGDPEEKLGDENYVLGE